MISKLTGKLIEAIPPQVVIDVNGVAYEADVSMQTFYTLPPVGETVSLYTQLIVREDAHLLFGFGSHSERNTFRQLIKVSGIGAKTALGIGKKTAERMVLELRGKLTTSSGVQAQLAAQADDSSEDIVSTLLALGYNEKEARAAAKGIPADTEVGEGVRLALKNLLK